MGPYVIQSANTVLNSHSEAAVCLTKEKDGRNTALADQLTSTPGGGQAPYVIGRDP